MVKPQISIVITNWNGKSVLKDCLTSLNKQSYKNFETIVIENGSKDGSTDMVKKEFPKVILIANKENKGFCGGMNQGVRKAKAKFVFLLNNDTELDKNCIKNLVKCWKNKPREVIALFPKIYYFDNRKVINAFRARWTKWRFWTLAYKDKIDKGQFNKSERIFADNYVAICFRKKEFEKIGMFDESFFIYAEDQEVSYRLNVLGYSIFTCPNSILYHKESMSIKNNFEGDMEVNRAIRHRQYGTRNYLICILKNYELKNLFIFFPYALLRLWFYHGIIRGIIITKRPLKIIFISIKNLTDIIGDFNNILKKRKKIQTNRKVKDSEIWKL